jgi:hypothetical protein
MTIFQACMPSGWRVSGMTVLPGRTTSTSHCANGFTMSTSPAVWGSATSVRRADDVHLHRSILRSPEVDHRPPRPQSNRKRQASCYAGDD